MNYLDNLCSLIIRLTRKLSIDGKPIVFFHTFMIDGSRWQIVVDKLPAIAEEKPKKLTAFG